MIAWLQVMKSGSAESVQKLLCLPTTAKMSLMYFISIFKRIFQNPRSTVLLGGPFDMNINEQSSFCL